jgi:hypothetical protein
VGDAGTGRDRDAVYVNHRGAAREGARDVHTIAGGVHV